jgi:hypothetical protein
MSRRPNLWIVVPSLVFGALGGFISWAVMDLSCRPGLNLDRSSGCPVAAVGVGVGVGIATTLALAIVLVLVFRSLAEHRSAIERNLPPPTPGCEVPESPTSDSD